MEINVLNHQIANLEKINDKFAMQSQPQVQELVGQYKNFVLDLHEKMEKKLKNETLDTTQNKTQTIPRQN